MYTLIKTFCKEIGAKVVLQNKNFRQAWSLVEAIYMMLEMIFEPMFVAPGPILNRSYAL